MTFEHQFPARRAAQLKKRYPYLRAMWAWDRWKALLPIPLPLILVPMIVFGRWDLVQDGIAGAIIWWVVCTLRMQFWERRWYAARSPYTS